MGPALDDSTTEHEKRELLDAEIEKAALLTIPTVSESRRSTSYLDGFRGLAALLVFNSHFLGGGVHEFGFGQVLGDNVNHNWQLISLPFIRVFYVGAPAAVSIFFVLSGFVVTQTLLKLIRDDKHGDYIRAVSSAAIRRPLRLYLPCWGFALIVALAFHLPWDIYPPLPWLHPKDSIVEEIVHCLRECWKYFQPLQYHAAPELFFVYDLVVWTIPIELKGSFYCYGLTILHTLATRAFGSNSRVHVWAVGLLFTAAIILLRTAFWWQACFLVGYAYSVIDVFGMDKSLLNRASHLKLTGGKVRAIETSSIALYSMLFCGWYLLSVPSSSGHPEWQHQVPGFRWLARFMPEEYEGKDGEPYRLWTSIGAMLVVYATMRLSPLQTFFKTRPLQYLGKVSFMLYLIHLPVAYGFSDRWQRVFGHTSWGSEPRWYDGVLWIPYWGIIGFNTRLFFCYSTVLGVNLALAHLLTRYLDEPCVKLGKYVVSGLGLSPRGVAASEANLPLAVNRDPS